MKETFNSEKMIKNTVMLYTRQIFILIINLVSVRILLGNLGEEDYGLYTLVAGITTMFSILSGAMSSASQRFYSYYMGAGKESELKKCVWTSLIVYGLIAIVVIVVTESVGLWYICNRLVVPVYRYKQVVVLYQFSVISLMITIFSTPFIAYVLSSEDMNVYAIISIIEVLLKFLTAIFIGHIDVDVRLSSYGILLAGISLASFLLYLFVVKTKYNWKLGGKFDKGLFREMLSFASWNLFGSAIFSFKNQAVNIVINQTFSPVVVSARGVATSVYSALVSFSTNFSNALKPQIVKNYASGEEKLYKLVSFSSKITFLLMLIIMFPFWYDMTYILRLWLGNVPDYAVIFARLGLIEALIDSITLPVIPLADATGKIKNYQLIVGGILLLNFPLSYVFIKIIGTPVVVYYIAIILTALASIARIICTSKISGLSAQNYIKDVTLKAVAVMGILFGFVEMFNQIIHNIALCHAISYAIYIGTLIVAVRLILFNKYEKSLIVEIINEKIIKRIRNR